MKSEIISIYKGVKSRTLLHLRELAYLKPFENKMSSYELVGHIGLIERDLFIEKLKTGTHIYDHSNIENYNNKEVANHLYETVFLQTLDFLQSKDDAFFQQSIKSLNGNQISIFKWLNLLLEHEIHHRSQLLFYLSLSGVEIQPIFGLKSEYIKNHQ